MTNEERTKVVEALTPLWEHAASHKHMVNATYVSEQVRRTTRVHVTNEEIAELLKSMENGNV